MKAYCVIDIPDSIAITNGTIGTDGVPVIAGAVVIAGKVCENVGFREVPRKKKAKYGTNYLAFTDLGYNEALDEAFGG